MGRNSRRRQLAREVVRDAQPRTVRSTTKETVTVRRLRARMALVATRAQFERIIATTVPDNRPAMRRLLEPMLKPDLPCCATWAVRTAVSKEITEQYGIKRLNRPFDTGEPEHCLGCPSLRVM